MFGMAGIAYVYFVYGMHYCFNVVTGAAGDPQAVLVRGGVDHTGATGIPLPGPARFCRALSIDLACNGADLCQPAAGAIWFESGGGAPIPIVVTPRVGVRDGSPLRFLTGPTPPRGPKLALKRKRAPKGSLV